MPDDTPAGQGTEEPHRVFVSLNPNLATSPLRRALAAARRPPATPTTPDPDDEQENQAP